MSIDEWLALEAQWRQTPPLVFSVQAIAVYLGALEPPAAPSKPAGTAGEEDLIDETDPDWIDFMRSLSACGGG